MHSALMLPMLESSDGNVCKLLTHCCASTSLVGVTGRLHSKKLRWSGLFTSFLFFSHSFSRSAVEYRSFSSRRARFTRRSFLSLASLGGKRVSPALVPPVREAVRDFLNGCSIEVMPRTAAAVDDFRPLLAPGSRVYIAQIEGTKLSDMIATAKRLASEGFEVMPHIPARLIRSVTVLEDLLDRYHGEAGVKGALLLAGGVSKARGSLDSSMDLLSTGLFDRKGFDCLHVAGHPEGNRDIDPDGSDTRVMEALRWKQMFASRTNAEMGLVTQFCFEAGPVVAWVERLKVEGVDIPVHIGVAGPAKLHAMLKFAAACGIGPSLRVLQRRAKDASKLLLPFEPDEFISELALRKAENPDFNIESVHFFPLGGIRRTAEWVGDRRYLSVRSNQGERSG